MPDTSPAPVDSAEWIIACALADRERLDYSDEAAETTIITALREQGYEIVPARASIGPDSERLRELEAALPGPDDIVVSREALTTVLDLIHERVLQEPLPASLATRTVRFWRDELADLAVAAAALSQPHPAQEQQT